MYIYLTHGYVHNLLASLIHSQKPPASRLSPGVGTKETSQACPYFSILPFQITMRHQFLLIEVIYGRPLSGRASRDSAQDTQFDPP